MPVEQKSEVQTPENVISHFDVFVRVHFEKSASNDLYILTSDNSNVLQAVLELYYSVSVLFTVPDIEKIYTKVLNQKAKPTHPILTPQFREPTPIGSSKLDWEVFLSMFEVITRENITYYRLKLDITHPNFEWLPSYIGGGSLTEADLHNMFNLLTSH